MDLLVVDFETYWDTEYSLSKMTTESYVRDPRFEVNICGFKLAGHKSFTLLPERTYSFITQEIDWANTACISQHAHFEGLILSHHYGVQPAFWLDTLSMARVVDGPKVHNGLEFLAKRYNLRQKDLRTLHMSRGKHLDDFSRDEFKLYCHYCMDDCENEYDLAQIFLPQITEFTLRLQDLKIRMFTEPVFIGNVELLREAVAAERTRKSGLLERLGITKEVLSSNDQFAQLLTDIGVEVPMKLGKPLETELAPGVTEMQPKWIPAFAKTDPGMQELLEHEDEVVRHLAEARLAIKSTIIQTRAERFLGCAERGLMPVYIKPNGVHTGRGSAGDKMNWMNMTSVNTIRPEMTVLKRSIMAPPGCVIVGADSAQIQARSTAWLAGQADKIQAFAEGRDVYSEFASVIYNRPVDRKQNKDDFIPGQVGKISELSLMFGAGWYTSAVNFLKGYLGAPPIQFTEQDMVNMQVDPSRFLNNPKKVQQVADMPSRLELNDRLIHCLVVDYIVRRWRTRNPMIAGSKEIEGLWDTMEHVIDAMIAGVNLPFGPNGFMHTEKEAIILPSGNRIRYRGLERSDSGDATYFDGRQRIHIYGGAMTNNVIQGLEQEIMGAAFLKFADAGYKVATEVYDSAAIVVPEEYAQQCLDFMLATLKERPSWGLDLPLNAEGGFARTYGEVK